MKIYALCPCCSDKLIHHIGHHRDYWFCRGCWQEMPVIQDQLITQKSNQTDSYEKAPVKVFSKIRQLKHVSLPTS